MAHPLLPHYRTVAQNTLASEGGPPDKEAGRIRTAPSHLAIRSCRQLVSPEPITVLHLVGGLEWRGGCARVVEKLAWTRIPGVNHCVWMHCDYKPATGELLFITKGRATNLNTGLVPDLLAVLQEFGPIFRWARGRDRLVLHAHSRAGIFAASLVHWLTGARLIIHLHFLARRPWLYRCLQRLFSAKMIYNSKRTCLHYGGDPHTASIFVPSITWPSQPPAGRDGVQRF